jgi:hypothetical protein
MNDVKIEVRCDPSAEERDLIVNGLVEFNESPVGDARFKDPSARLAKIGLVLGLVLAGSGRIKR